MSVSLDLPQRRARKLSLTALIDVVFILLMFFMITSSFSHWRSLDIESTAAGSSDTSNEPAPVVLLRTSGALLALIGTNTQNNTQNNSWQDDNWQDGIDQPLLDALQNTQQPMTLVPEADVRVDAIISLIAELESHGISNISLGDALPREMTGQGEGQNHE